MKSINNIEQEEKRLYVSYYLGDNQPFHGYPEGSYVTEAAMFIEKTVKKESRLLEIGCGHGRTARYLIEKGFNILGVDITLAGLPGYSSYEVDSRFFEAPIWRLPFRDNHFDYTFSMDVLEHLPTKLIDKSIEEIYRITKVKTFHAISTIDDKNYIEAHKTVKPIIWWEKQFSKLNNNQVDTHIMDGKEFMDLLLILQCENKRRIA